ncbi:MAG: 3-hydroxyisobutyrate dehydrogenase [Hyphomonadaceae bacterium]|nr:3-hydroxyisobutyrate dehydrogenase [Hyphomonadaceae bacterium]
MRIAFIGLGNMGSGMCANLVKAGHQVTAFDLNAEAVSAATKAGASAATSIAKAVLGAEAVVTMLPAGKHVLSVYFDAHGVASKAEAGTLFLDCSTIAVEDARTASNKAAELGFEMADAPVSGGVAAASGGTLTFMVGGTESAFARAKPILEAMGKTIVHAGAAGNGQVAKIANNMLLGISMIATCEAFDLAERLGLDAQTFFDISSKASGQNWSMTSYCPAPGPVPTAPSNRDYEPGFAVDMMLKDLRLAAGAAKSADANTRFGTLATEVYEKLSENGFGNKDFSVIMQHLGE